MLYLTPEKFRTMGFGLDFTDIEDVALRSTLHRASAVVEAYCNVPLQPQRYDFRGGTMTGERHEWSSDAYDRPMPYRFWPWAQPVLAVSEFRVYSTPDVYVAIDPTEMFINNSAGWIEVSSLKLTQFGIFGAGVVTTLIGMYHPVAQATYTYGYRFAESGEYLEPTDASLYRAQNQFWDSTVPPVIRKNNVIVLASDYTIDYTEGTVLFTTPLAADDVVTASYTYTLPWQIAQATGIIAAEDLGESGLRGKGMAGVDHLTVGEISIRRSSPLGQRGGTMVAETVPIKAQTLLDGFAFITAR